MIVTLRPADVVARFMGAGSSEMGLPPTQLPSISRPDLVARRTQVWAAGLAAGAGLVHALAGEGHFAEWWGYGMFFLLVSMCQFMGGAALLFWSDKRLYWTGIVGTVVVLAVWTASRTIGVPIGPDGSGPEKVGVLDAVSVILELGLIWCLAQLTRHPATPILDGAFDDTERDDSEPT